MGIRGALSSLPAFVAAPNVAQALTEGVSPAQSQALTGEGERPVIQPHTQPPQGDYPQPDMDIDQPDNTKNTDTVTSSSIGIAPNQSSGAAAGNIISSNAGVQTVWPSSPSGEDTDESGGGFGYATIKQVGYVSSKDSDEHLRSLPEVPAQHVHIHETANGVGSDSKSHHLDSVNSRPSDDALYTQVKKSSHKKEGLGTSFGLPPRTPTQPEQTKREDRENSPMLTKQRESTRHDRKNTDEIKLSPSEQGRRRQAHSNKIDSTLVYHFDDGLAGETERRASWEGAEYTDEEYMPSGDDTFSITETNFSEEDLILHSDLSPPHSSKRDKHGRSSPLYATHHSAYGHRSATPGERHTHRRTRPERYSHRPASAPQPNLDSIQLIRPSFIQHLPSTRPQSSQLGSDGEVYIFSEAQGDGSVQYYSATPVHTPTRVSQASYRTPSFQQPATPTLLGPHFMEPRHYSNPATTSPVQPQQKYTSPANQQYTSPAQPQQYALSASGRDSALRGTKITKLGGPVSQNSLRTDSPLSARVTLPADTKGSGLDQTDTNYSAESPRTLTGVAKPLMSSHSMSRDQDKIRSLSVTLDQQLVSEQRYLKLKEVSY